MISLSPGDYHFTPDTLEVQTGRPVVLTLTNTDTLTPHNITLQEATAGLDIDTDISAGSTSTVEQASGPVPVPSSATRNCCS